MWPDAKMKDKEMFTHLNFEFDLGKGEITAETAAKDYHGVPIYSHVYDTSTPPTPSATVETAPVAEAAPVAETAPVAEATPVVEILEPEVP